MIKTNRVKINNNVAVNVNTQSPGDGTFVSNGNLQVPAVNMSQIQVNNTVATLENTATLSVSLKSGVAKEITMTVNAPSGTSNFSTETNFDYNTTTGWTAENNIRRVKLVENASISNMEQPQQHKNIHLQVNTII